MSTSVTNLKQRHQRGLTIYIIVTLLLIATPFIYELFSYGEYSYFMRYMFLAPLLLGVLPYWYSLKTHRYVFQSRQSYRLLNTSVAAIVCACLVRSIITISGRMTSLDTPLWIVAIMSLLLAIYFLYKQTKNSDC